MNIGKVYMYLYISIYIFIISQCITIMLSGVWSVNEELDN